MEEGLGFRFWASFVGIVIVGAIAVLVGMLIFTRAVYAWGVFGVLIAFSVVLLLGAWVHDRRQAKRYEAEAE